MEKYLTKKKELYNNLLGFIDDDADLEDSFKQLSEFFINQTIQQSKEDLTTLFHIITNISNHRHRSPDFFTKIEKIITYLENEIRQFYSNHEIFNLFKSNKRVLLFLIEKELLKIDESIVQIISKDKYKKNKYPFYFYPEIKPFLSQNIQNQMITKVSEMESVNSDEFENNRKRAENHRYICQLIQKDSIDDFIIFVTKNNISLSSTIENSIFETNDYLLNSDEVDLISYSAFYGSIQIFRFLYMNQVKTTPLLWFFTIYGRNAEIIHLLEEYHIQPYLNSYTFCFNASILCHHNEIAKYIEENLIDHKISLSKSVRYYNFEYFDKDIFNDLFSFYYACKYDNLFVVKYMLEHSKNIDINTWFKDVNIKQTVLSAAINERNNDIVKILLSQPNIDVNIRYELLINNDDLYMPTEEEEQNDDNERYKYRIKKSPLIEAIEQGDLELVNLLLSNDKIDVNFQLEYHDFGEYGSYHIEKTPLIMAIEKGNTKIVESLLKHPDINVNQISKHNDGSYGFPSGHDRYIEKIALIIAVEKENLEIVNLLLNHPKIDVNITSRYHDYIYYGYEGYRGNKYQERTALQIAVMMNNIEIVKLLLNHPKINTNMLLSVYEYNHNNINEDNYKTDFNAYQNSFDCEKDSYVLIDPMIAKEQNIFLFDESDFRSFVTINFSKLSGSNNEKEEKSPLIMSIENKGIDVVRCLLSCPNINVNYKSLVISDNGSLVSISPLHRAIQINCSEIIQLLKDHNAVDIYDINHNA